MKIILIFLLTLFEITFCNAQNEIKYLRIYPDNSVHQNREGYFDNYSYFDLRFKYNDYSKMSKCIVTFYAEEEGNIPLTAYYSCINSGYNYNYLEDEVTFYDTPLNKDGYTRLAMSTANLPMARIFICYYGESKVVSIRDVKINFIK